jgi:hypothetical protein
MLTVVQTIAVHLRVPAWRSRLALVQHSWVHLHTLQPSHEAVLGSLRYGFITSPVQTKQRQWHALHEARRISSSN